VRRSIRASRSFSTVGGISTETSLEAVTPRLADERAGLEERAHELFEVEGIPLGLAEHSGGDVVRKRLRSHEHVEQRGLRVALQRLERELAGQVRVLAERQLAQAPG
jgi:hypothetical protein